MLAQLAWLVGHQTVNPELGGCNTARASKVALYNLISDIASTVTCPSLLTQVWKQSVTSGEICKYRLDNQECRLGGLTAKI